MFNVHSHIKRKICDRPVFSNRCILPAFSNPCRLPPSESSLRIIIIIITAVTGSPIIDIRNPIKKKDYVTLNKKKICFNHEKKKRSDKVVSHLSRIRSVGNRVTACAREAPATP
jgi:hypothetical protein